MKITIKRFGPIKQFEYDLEKDIIVTYGNNNIGKSYAMQVVYLLLKTFINAEFFMWARAYKNLYIMPAGIADTHLKTKIRETIKQFIEDEEKSRDITDIIQEGTNDVLTKVFMSDFINSCKNTFGNLSKTLEGKPEIIIEQKNVKYVVDLQNTKMEVVQDIKPIRLKKSSSTFHKSRKSTKSYDIYVVNDIEIPEKIAYQAMQDNVIQCMGKVSMEFDNVYFLPASRSGIYSGMNAFGSIVAELSKSRAYITKKIEFPGISEPISDYFLFLSNIKAKENENLSEFYSAIEEEILKGKVAFDKNKNALIYKPKNVEATFEMTEVSSMVSEISPIVAFLKYILTSTNRKPKKKKSVLFIEEPEAHLHPINQIRLIEIFSKLINENVKLVMSSHSNYVFNKLNNMVLGKSLDCNVYQPIMLTESDEGSVSKSLFIDELGADDENFVDVSEQLYYEREELIEKLNMEE